MWYFNLVHRHFKYCIISWAAASGLRPQSLELLYNNILK